MIETKQVNLRLTQDEVEKLQSLGGVTTGIRKLLANNYHDAMKGDFTKADYEVEGQSEDIQFKLILAENILRHRADNPSKQRRLADIWATVLQKAGFTKADPQYLLARAQFSQVPAKRLIQEHFKVIVENDSDQDQHLAYSCIFCERRMASSYDPKRASVSQLFTLRRDSLNAEAYLIHHLMYVHNLNINLDEEAMTGKKVKMRDLL